MSRVLPRSSFCYRQICIDLCRFDFVFFLLQTEQLTFICVLFAFIIIGNTSVLVTIFISKSRKSRMNFFIMQLAIAGKTESAGDISWIIGTVGQRFRQCLVMLIVTSDGPCIFYGIWRYWLILCRYWLVTLYRDANAHDLCNRNNDIVHDCIIYNSTWRSTFLKFV